MMDEDQEQFSPQQGALQNCVYCSIIYPELKGDCPRCGGAGTRFREARMMDRESSSLLILEMINETDLSGYHEIEEAMKKRERLIALLRDIVLYDFDIRSAIITRIKDIDNELDVDIKERK
ncbi:MAG: hypothetical protein ACMUIE_07195 [Thermoplasmatota archaeon]